MTTLTLRLTIGTAADQLKAAFLGVPGTQLSPTDAAALSGFDSQTCRVLLDWLEDARFLRRTPDGLYTRQEADAPTDEDTLTAVRVGRGSSADNER